MIVATQSLKSGSVSKLELNLTVLEPIGYGHISESFLSIFHFFEEGKQARD